jgi:hypothetical protein
MQQKTSHCNILYSHHHPLEPQRQPQHPLQQPQPQFHQPCLNPQPHTSIASRPKINATASTPTSACVTAYTSTAAYPKVHCSSANSPPPSASAVKSALSGLQRISINNHYRKINIQRSSIIRPWSILNCLPSLWSSRNSSNLIIYTFLSSVLASNSMSYNLSLKC